jgi:flavin reductase (DIM6/NTAB) family NADH-FMN oxidoreductase RutF
MDEQAKKTALLMIPYGLYVLGTKSGDDINVSTVNWVTQTAFKPPLVAIGVKAEGRTFEMLKESGVFALSFLESGQKDLAFAFFRPVTPENGKFSGYAYETAETGAPIVSDAPAWVEGRIVGTVEVGDHWTFVGEVTNAGLKRESKVLTLEEVGVKYGG